MKLLLTSAGLTNSSLAKAMEGLAGLPKSKIHIAVIPTAANVEEGDKSWLIDDLINIKKQNYGTVDIVDVSALPRDIWLPRIKHANIVFVEGGNTFHLMHSFSTSGFAEEIGELLKTRVYVGVSAGSCVTSPTIYNSVQNLFGETYKLRIKEGLNLVNLQFVPHLNSNYFPKIRKKYIDVASKKIKEPIYAMDDQSGIKIEKDKLTIISEGKYLVYNTK